MKLQRDDKRDNWVKQGGEGRGNGYSRGEGWTPTLQNIKQPEPRQFIDSHDLHWSDVTLYQEYLHISFY